MACTTFMTTLTLGVLSGRPPELGGSTARAADVRPAERLHDAAVVAYKRGKLRQAVELWRGALELDASWKYAYNLANTLYELEDGREAWAAVTRAEALGPPAQHVGIVAELQSKVRALLFKDHGWLVVTVTPPGAVVKRNGVRWEPPYEVWTNEPESALEVAAEGFVARTTIVSHPIGSRTAITIDLDAVVVPTIVEPVVVVEPPVEPVLSEPVAPRVQEPADLTLPGWATFGAGLALAGVGTGFYLWADGTRDDLIALNGSPEALARFEDYDAYARHYADTRDAMDDRELVGQVLLVAGGLAIVTGVVLIVMDEAGPSTPTMGVVPVSGGAALVGGASF